MKSLASRALLQQGPDELRRFELMSSRSTCCGIHHSSLRPSGSLLSLSPCNLSEPHACPDLLRVHAAAAFIQTFRLQGSSCITMHGCFERPGQTDMNQ